MKSSPMIVLLLFVCIALCGFPVYSDDGSGWVLYSDIAVTLDGTPVPAYNIESRTYVTTETLAELGFDVTVDEEAKTITVGARTLVTSPILLAADEDPEEAATRVSGQRCGKYEPSGYGVTILGEAAECFDVDGHTCVCLDDVALAFAAADGYVWDADARELSLKTAAPQGK